MHDVGWTSKPETYMKMHYRHCNATLSTAKTLPAVMRVNVVLWAYLLRESKTVDSTA